MKSLTSLMGKQSTNAALELLSHSGSREPDTTTSRIIATTLKDLRSLSPSKYRQVEILAQCKIGERIIQWFFPLNGGILVNFGLFLMSV